MSTNTQALKTPAGQGRRKAPGNAAEKERDLPYQALMKVKLKLMERDRIGQPMVQAMKLTMDSGKTRQVKTEKATLTRPKGYHRDHGDHGVFWILKHATLPLLSSSKESKPIVEKVVLQYFLQLDQEGLEDEESDCFENIVCYLETFYMLHDVENVLKFKMGIDFEGLKNKALAMGIPSIQPQPTEASTTNDPYVTNSTLMDAILAQGNQLGTQLGTKLLGTAEKFAENMQDLRREVNEELTSVSKNLSDQLVKVNQEVGSVKCLALANKAGLESHAEQLREHALWQKEHEVKMKALILQIEPQGPISESSSSVSRPYQVENFEEDSLDYSLPSQDLDRFCQGEKQAVPSSVCFESGKKVEGFELSHTNLPPEVLQRDSLPRLQGFDMPNNPPPQVLEQDSQSFSTFGRVVPLPRVEGLELRRDPPPPVPVIPSMFNPKIEEEKRAAAAFFSGVTHHLSSNPAKLRKCDTLGELETSGAKRR